MRISSNIEIRQANHKPNPLGVLPVINEDAEDGEVYDLPEKPKYFDMLDEDMVDSEDELVSGENNYIEIKCLPLELEVKKEAPKPEEKKEAVPVAEEEKKEVAKEFFSGADSNKA